MADGLTQAEIIYRARSISNEVRETIAFTHSVCEKASTHLSDYYKIIPAAELSEHIHLSFKTFDKNRDGKMQIRELGDALAEMGHRPTADELHLLYQRFDLDRNGTVEIDEYEHMVRVSLDMQHACRCRACTAQKEAAKVVIADPAPEKVVPKSAVLPKFSQGNSKVGFGSSHNVKK
mmetsp:Transcript_2415/g.5788  ORF Transcript_2415/g.5788 Transcript_2415/m.5788 type:complete len:177 (+) Transcript_2415:227-757(+)